MNNNAYITAHNGTQWLINSQVYSHLNDVDSEIGIFFMLLFVLCLFFFFIYYVIARCPSGWLQYKSTLINFYASPKGNCTFTHARIALHSRQTKTHCFRLAREFF